MGSNSDRMSSSRWDHVYRQNYRSDAFRDYKWLQNARALMACAKALEPLLEDIWESHRAIFRDKRAGHRLKPNVVNGPYFMLVAFAIENLLKARIVTKNAMAFREQFDLDNRFPKVLKGHNLYDLALRAGIEITKQEEDLLRRLTRNATWAGRYPVPLHYRDTASAERFADGEEYLVSFFSGNDVAAVNRLYMRLEEIADGWKTFTLSDLLKRLGLASSRESERPVPRWTRIIQWFRRIGA